MPHLSSLHGKLQPGAWQAATQPPEQSPYGYAEMSPGGTPRPLSPDPSSSSLLRPADAYGAMTSRGGSGLVVNSAYDSYAKPFE